MQIAETIVDIIRGKEKQPVISKKGNPFQNLSFGKFKVNK